MQQNERISIHISVTNVKLMDRDEYIKTASSACKAQPFENQLPFSDFTDCTFLSTCFVIVKVEYLLLNSLKRVEKNRNVLSNLRH